jgi:hypothetical protein
MRSLTRKPLKLPYYAAKIKGHLRLDLGLHRTQAAARRSAGGIDIVVQRVWVSVDA